MVFAYMACAILAFVVYRISHKLPDAAQLAVAAVVFVGLAAAITTCQRQKVEEERWRNDEEMIRYEESF